MKQSLTKSIAVPQCSFARVVPAADYADPARLAAAISSAGGVAFESLDERLMIRTLPGVFCAGEMLDWEAPTGGYLLTACFASGRAAGLGAVRWLNQEEANGQD